MKNYKVCVYAICKNEEKFVDRWADSMKEADKIMVLDTGSTDRTVELLINKGIEVYEEIISPWRFDVARNKILEKIPDDYEICVCTDLDEVIEPGWKEKLLKIWNNDTTRVRYTYNWSFDEYGKPATSFLANKIHKNGLYKWTHPVHEVLTALGDEKEVIAEDIVINHYPDSTKSRGGYLPLLELSVKEDGEDDRNMHYLGREYMYYKRWDEAIEALKKHLTLKKATWKDERAASMRFIARCYKAKGNQEEAINWYKQAINEAPYLRESYIELAFIYYENKDYLIAYDYLRKALEIKEKSKSYINEEFAWNSFVYDLISICSFNLGYYEESVMYVKKALSLDKNNIRLQLNLEYMENYIS